MAKAKRGGGPGPPPTNPPSAVNAGRAGDETSKSSGARERDDKWRTEQRRRRVRDDDPVSAVLSASPQPRSECSEVVRWSGLPRDVYRPEISTKSALFPRFRQREIEAYHRVLIVVRPRKGGVGTHDAIAERLSRRSE